MILAIDFDGTIVHDQFPGIGPLKPNSKEVINRLYSEGYFIIIWTCRTLDRMTECIDFLDKNGIKYHLVNISCPTNVEKYSGIDTRKIFADLYIDDKGLIILPDWETIYDIVHQRLPTHCDKIEMEGHL
jgi:hypothetical protein